MRHDEMKKKVEQNVRLDVTVCTKAAKEVVEEASRDLDRLLEDHAKEVLSEKLRAERHAAELEAEKSAHAETCVELASVAAAYAVAADREMYLKASLLHLGGQLEGVRAILSGLPSILRTHALDRCHGAVEALGFVVDKAIEQHDEIVESFRAEC